jgi:chemotaxis protein CheZ
VPVEDVAQIVQELFDSLEGEIVLGHAGVRQEIREIVDFIQQAKQEVVAIRTKEIHGQFIPDATDELDAVVKATEEATEVILDAAESLEAISEKFGGETGEEISTIVTKIYEASNFQDITGQRIGKVVGTLRHIEDKLRRLSIALGDGEDETKEVEQREQKASVDDEASLLNGPQLDGLGNSQDEIDALLAEFD